MYLCLKQVRKATNIWLYSSSEWYWECFDLQIPVLHMRASCTKKLYLPNVRKNTTWASDLAFGIKKRLRNGDSPSYSVMKGRLFWKSNVQSSCRPSWSEGLNLLCAKRTRIESSPHQVFAACNIENERIQPPAVTRSVLGELIDWSNMGLTGCYAVFLRGAVGSLAAIKS